MLLILLSAMGTLRLILILLVIYLVLRMIMRSQGPSDRPPGSHWTNEPPRPKGDVRIERPNDQRSGRGQGHVEDADYEEIK